MTFIKDTVLNRKVIITCGVGGAGKTTCSSAIALYGALHGKRVCVITIDPAKRLAQSLGISTLSHEPQNLSDFVKKEEPELKGSFFASIPSTEKSLNQFFKDMFGSESDFEKFSRNPIYKMAIREYAGASEYMAIDKLLRVVDSKQFDLVVLDTPPSRDTLSFLEAPKTLSQFFEEKLLRFLVMPSNKIIGAGIRKALSLLEGLTGSGFMNNVFDFAASIFEIRLNFESKITSLLRLLSSNDVGFILVSGPQSSAARELGHFLKIIQENKYHFDGIIINKSLSNLNPVDANQHDLSETDVAFVKSQVHQEQLLLEKLPQKQVCKIPAQGRDIHSIKDLIHVAKAF